MSISPVNVCKYLRLEANNLVIRIFFKKPKRNKKYYASLCTIFKNEAKYLEEWVNYHLIVGFEHFYVYNNFSEDNYLEVLKPYIDKGVLTLIEWPHVNGQKDAYNHCLTTFANESYWIAFQDADEFAVPVKHNDVKDYLKNYEKFPCVLGFYRNYTSGGIIKEDVSIPVIEQFTSCSEFSLPSSFFNTHYNYLLKEFKLTHYARYKYFNKICAQHCAFFSGVTKTIKYPDFQFNHYYNKSLEYYINKKIPGGDCYNNKKHSYDMDKFYYMDNLGIYKDFTIYKYLTKLKTFNLDEFCDNKQD